MASLPLDLTGKGGLAPNFAGDLNDTAAAPNLRYEGGDSQMADGFYNPLRFNGYLSPANNTFTSLTGTISAQIVGKVYDSRNDVMYFAQRTPNLLSLDGLDDTSLSAVTSVSTDRNNRDIEQYEINGEPAIIYCFADENLQGGTVNDNGVGLGFRALDTSRGVFQLEVDVYNSGLEDASETISSAGNTKLAQMFTTSDFNTATYIVTGVRLLLRSVGGTGQTWTMRVGIQTDNAGRPSGSYVANASVDIDPNTLSTEYDYRYYEFPADISLSGSTTYHIVVEPTNAGDLSGAEGVSWMRTDLGGGLYTNGEAQQYTGGAWADADTTSESFDFAIILNSSASLVNRLLVNNIAVNGDITQTKDSHQFLIKSDNGQLYWFTDHRVHKFDGTKETGGPTGTFTRDVLKFASYMKTIDAVDTHGYMYIAAQSSERNTTDNRTFNADFMGVYVWDRRSTVGGFRDFIPVYNAREIKNIFLTTNGDVRLITIGEDRFTEIRGLVGGKFEVLHRLGLDAYPLSINSIDHLNNLSIWIGKDGIVYGLGRINGNEAIYKLADVSSQVTGTLTSGIIAVGHEESSQSRQGVYISFTDTVTGTPTYKLIKWYPHGQGTISSTAQTAKQGDVYTLVKYLPKLSILRDVTIYCKPTSTSTDTTIATIKFYKNQSSTAFATLTVTDTMCNKGYIVKGMSQLKAHAFQMEIEWAANTLGANDFCPSFGILNYSTTTQLK